MNQTQNRMPFGLLKKDEQADFVNNYESNYAKYLGNNDWIMLHDGYDMQDNEVYQLKIDPEKWYHCDGEIAIGKDLINAHEAGFYQYSEYEVLRPAITYEIPKQEKTLKERIEEEYSNYDVVVFEWGDTQGVEVLKFDRGRAAYLRHSTAQSIRDFAGYVYENKDQFDIDARPCFLTNEMELPVAVLFKKGGE